MIKRLCNYRPLSDLTLRETLHTLPVLGMMFGLGLGVIGVGVGQLVITRQVSAMEAVATLIVGFVIFGCSTWALLRIQKVKADLFARTDADKLRR